MRNRIQSCSYPGGLPCVQYARVILRSYAAGGPTWTPFEDLGVSGGAISDKDDYDATVVFSNGSVGLVTAHGVNSSNVDYCVSTNDGISWQCS